MKIILRAVAALALSMMLFFACTPEANYTSSLINQTRSEYGLPSLEFNVMLHLKAQGWAQQLAAQGYLSHSRLTDDNWSTTWTRLGENVGQSYSMEDVHARFMASSGHRANILGPYNKVGTGVVTQNMPDGTVKYWVVQEFMWEYCC